MGKNRVKVTILGSDYVILTEDPEQQILEMAAEVEDQINSFIESSPALSSSMASVLAALNLCDAKKKAEQSADNLRAQIKEYLQEAERGRSLSAMAQETAREAAEEARKLKTELGVIRDRLTEEASSVKQRAHQEIEEAKGETARVREEMTALKERLAQEMQTALDRAKQEIEESRALAAGHKEENERLKNQMSGEMKSEAEAHAAVQVENARLQEENAKLREQESELSARLREREDALTAELLQAQQDSAQLAGELEEFRQSNDDLKRRVAGETTAIQLQFKKDLEEAKKQVEPLMQEILLLQKQVNLLTERGEEAEREAATLRLALSRQEGSNASAVPAGAQYFSGGHQVERVDDSESTTDDLLSFFNLRQN